MTSPERVLLFASLGFTALVNATCTEPCDDGPAAVSVEARLIGREVLRTARSLRVVLRIDDTGYQRTFDLPTPNEPSAEFAVTLDPEPTSDGFGIDLQIEAYAGLDGRGMQLSAASAQATGTRDACNRLVVDLDDPPGLEVAPERFDAPWTDRGTTVVFTAQATAFGPIDLETLTVTSTVPWLDPALGPTVDHTRPFTVTASTADLEVGVYTATVRVTVADLPAVDVPVSIRVFRPIHVGPEPNTCPHDTQEGTPTRACDFEGRNAVNEAAGTMDSYDHLVLHDRTGEAAFYDAAPNGVLLPATSWMSAATETNPQNVVVRCEQSQGLRLTGDGVRLERFSLLAAQFCSPGIRTWPTNAPTNGSGGHEIDQMILAALQPEIYGVNNVFTALGLSEDTKVTNSHFYGYWEGVGDLSFADRTELVGNTFVFYQNFANTIIANDVNDVKVVNNVFVALPSADAPLIQADARTTRLLVAGNLLEGYVDQIVASVDGLDPSNRVVQNVVGEVPLVSPHEPQFLSDASVQTSTAWPSETTSLDGVDVDGQTPALPGAFQLRSSRPLPRRTNVRLGPAGCTACDLTADVNNEVQVAAWSVWPGHTLEIDPGEYAGDAVITWPISIAGQGAQADAVELHNRDEVPLWREGRVWTRHNAVVAVVRDARAPLTIENLAVVLNAGNPTRDHALFLEGGPPNEEPPEQHIVRNVIMRTASPPESGAAAAIITGNNVLFQDVLIHGTWSTCARVAQNFRNDQAPASIGSTFINLTCRLTGEGPTAAQAGFDVAAVRDSAFINLVVDNTSPSNPPLLRAQSRTAGDDGPVALDPPVSLDVNAVHYRGFSGLFGRFDMASGVYTVTDIEALARMTELFVSDADSRLADSSNAIDTGFDLASPPTRWSLGTSLDGFDRTARAVDRGAYEQGQ